MKRILELTRGAYGVLTILAVLAVARPGAAQTISPELQAAYATFYRGDYPAADAQFAELASRHPDDLGGPFGQLIVAHARIGPESGASPTFEQHIDGFIAKASERYDRNRSDDDALFHLAFAYTLRGIYKFEHQKGVLGAARDGAHARGYVDTYLRQHPENADAHLVRGIYNYFVDLAPSVMHVFRFLLFLPGGNRVSGLQDIEYAADHGQLFNRMAQLQLVDIYGALEGRPAQAIALGRRLETELPANDDVGFALADVYTSPAVEERDDAARIYEAIAARHESDRTPDGIAIRYRAWYALAGARFEAWRCDEALAILKRPIDAPAGAPDWVLPRFLLRRANYRMLLNDRGATDDAKRVLNDPTMARWHDDAHDMIKAIADFDSSGDPVLYAALVPANRLVVEGRYDEARREYGAIAEDKANEPQVRYRLAYLDFARGSEAPARPVFESLATDHTAPNWVRASAWLYLGRIADLAGQRPAATKDYQKVVDDYSSERAFEAAQVGLITPYQRPPH